MKIQAVNNTSFTGLYSNKASKNNGNWLMEYSPYSWENNNTSKMAYPEGINIYSDRLPDNEVIYKENTGYYSSKSSDILGTTYSYKAKDGTMRKKITEVPAMNREESLRVYNRKLDNFINEKQKKLDTNDYNEIMKQSQTISEDYHVYSDDVKHHYFSRIYNKTVSLENMDKDFSSMENLVKKQYENFELYRILRDSLDKAKLNRQENIEEIKLLESARNAGNLIDISRRDIYDPNKALWDALQDVKAAAGKYVALPHKTISVKKILEGIGETINGADIPSKAIKYVDNLIKQHI